MSSGNIVRAGHYTNSVVWTGTNNPRPPFGEHNYSKTIFSVNGEQSHIRSKNGVGQWYEYDTWRSDCSPEIARTFLSSTEADLKCQSKMSSSVRAFNSAVFMATLGESVGQIVHAASSVIGAYLSIRKGDIGGAARTILRSGTGSGYSRALNYRARRKALSSKDPASQWLAFQYGWLPLMSDIHEGVLAIGKMRQEFEMTVRVRASSKDVYHPANQRLDCERTAGVSRKYVLKEPPSANLQLGLIDPLSVAWELVPFSFVVDWFLPVGSFLENLAVLPYLQGTVVKGVLQRNILNYGNVTFTLSDAYGPVYVTRGGCHAYCINTTRTVSPISADSVVRPSLKSIDKAFSIGHIKNAAALLTVLLRN